jgi:hypothetical protein
MSERDFTCLLFRRSLALFLERCMAWLKPCADAHERLAKRLELLEALHKAEQDRRMLVKSERFYVDEQQRLLFDVSRAVQAGNLPAVEAAKAKMDVCTRKAREDADRLKAKLYEINHYHQLLDRDRPERVRQE